MSEGKILHICPLDKFIPPFIAFIKKNFDFDQHIFVLLGDIEKFPVELCGNVIHIKKRTEASCLFRLAYGARKIILHSIFIPKVVIFLAAQPWLLKKCYWVMWGGDLYHYKLRKRDLKHNGYELIRAFVIKRIGHFVTYVKGDYELAKKWYGITGEYNNCLMYQSNLYKEYSVPLKQGSAINILIGNSADPTNNHIALFEKLEPYKGQDIMVYCPLSYGQADYAERMAKTGKKLFGEKFVPLFDFIPFDKYLELLGEIDVAVFAHRRQQAMGNTITLLGLGKKVYLHSDVMQWKFFSELGVFVFDIEKFDINQLGTDEISNNKKIIADYFSERKLIEQCLNVFN